MCLHYMKTVTHCSGGTDSGHIMLKCAAPLLVWEINVFFTVNMEIKAHNCTKKTEIAKHKKDRM